MVAPFRALLFGVMVAWAWESTASDVIRDLLRVAEATPGRAALVVAGALKSFACRVLPWAFAWCSLEVGLARYRHLKKLRMTRDELKREFRESEGDPVIKGQRRAIHRGLAQGGSARGVGQAHAVVVNPTHLAVALRYAPGECDAPYVVARGRDRQALALRLEAEGWGIPVIRDVPLARSLISLELGEEVPEELYQAAAAVLKVAQEGACQ
jgi:type III secretion protein U